MSTTAVLDPPQTAIETPPLPDVLRAGAGFAVLGLCAGLGALDPSSAIRAIPASLAIAGAPFLLTTPALLVVHQMAGLRARPDQLVAVTATALVRAGRLALGLAPTALFFAATSDLALLVYILGAAAVGLLAVARSAQGFVLAERQASDSAPHAALMQIVALAWGGLTCLIGLRIAFEGTTWAFTQI